MNTKITKKEDDDDLKALEEYMKTSKDIRISFLTLLISLFLMSVFNIVMMYFR